MSRRILASGRCRVFSAISCIWSSSACSRRHSASAAASRGDSASAVAVTASICGRLLGLELLRRPLAALVVGVGRGGEELGVLSLAFAASAAAARPFSHCRSTVARWTLRLRANASIEESSRCCRPTTSSPAAACARRVVLAKRSSRAVRYSSRRRDSTSSGASSGRPSITTRSTIALREAALDLADVLLEPAHHDVLERLLAAHLDAAREAVGVEQLEQRGEAVRVAVVRRGREEQAVLEAAGEIAHGARELGLDAVAPAARRAPRGAPRRGSGGFRAAAARAIRASGPRRSGRSGGCARPGSGCACATGSRRSRARGASASGRRGRGSRTRGRSAPRARPSTARGPRAASRRRWSSPSCAGAARAR